MPADIAAERRQGFEAKSCSAARTYAAAGRLVCASRNALPAELQLSVATVFVKVMKRKYKSPWAMMARVFRRLEAPISVRGGPHTKCP
jgi:hypothetical protein